MLIFANLGQRLANTFAKTKQYLATLSWFWPPGSSFCERVANFSFFLMFTNFANFANLGQRLANAFAKHIVPVQFKFANCVAMFC